MILLAAVALRLVAVPVSPDYAYRMLYELAFEAALMWGYIVVVHVQLWRTQEATQWFGRAGFPTLGEPSYLRSEDI